MFTSGMTPNGKRSRRRLLVLEVLGHADLINVLNKTMKKLILLSVLFLVIGTTAAAQNNVPPEVREMARKVMMPVVYKVPGMERVKVVQNLKYTTINDPNVLMDVYLPPNAAPTQKRPAVILIHGGVKTEYTPKDWGIYTTWGRLIAASGFVGVTFTHRLDYT